MIRTFTNITKAALALAVTPAAVVADVLTLPATAYNGDHPFGHARAMLKRAEAAANEAVRPNPTGSAKGETT